MNGKIDEPFRYYGRYKLALLSEMTDDHGCLHYSFLDIGNRMFSYI